MVLLMCAASALHAGQGVPPVTVTPEPATIGLMAAGLGMLGAGAWWRSRRGK